MNHKDTEITERYLGFKVEGPKCKVGALFNFTCWKMARRAENISFSLCALRVAVVQLCFLGRTPFSP